MYRIPYDFGITPKFSERSILSLEYYTFELEKDKKKIYKDYRTMKIYSEKKIYNWLEVGEYKSICYLLSSKKLGFNGAMNGAARGGYRDLVEYFISLGANDFNEAMYGAARGDHRELVEYFVSLGANDFDWAMLGAALGGHREIVDYLKTLMNK
jgi:hypothetical protein